MDCYENVLEDIRRAVSEPESAEQQLEHRADIIIRELDEFMAMATNPETVDLIERNKIAMGQIMSRAQLICSFLMSRKAPAFKLVRNNAQAQ